MPSTEPACTSGYPSAAYFWPEIRARRPCDCGRFAARRNISQHNKTQLNNQVCHTFGHGGSIAAPQIMDAGIERRQQFQGAWSHALLQTDSPLVQDDVQPPAMLLVAYKFCTGWGSLNPKTSP